MLYAENSIQEMKKEDIVNKLSSNPLYEQVFNRIKDSVRSGEYKKGDLIPSEKELMELMGVSRVKPGRERAASSRWTGKAFWIRANSGIRQKPTGICLNSLRWPDASLSLLSQSRQPSWQQSRISVSWNMHSSMILRLQSRQSRLSGSRREPVFSLFTDACGRF